MSSADQLPAHEGAPGGDVHDRALRVANLPLSEEVQGTRREQYLLDSAHHGLAMKPARGGHDARLRGES